MPLQLLIIEDDDLIREVLVRYFGGQGCVVRAAATLAEARAALAAFVPQVILSDVLLVEGTGLDLYEQLDHTMQARVIFMTGYAGFVQEHLQNTGRPIIQKPFLLKTLWETIRAVAGQEI